MKRFLPTFILPLLFLSLFTGCQRDVQTPEGWSNGGTNNSIDDNVIVVGSIRGTVIDENNQPVTGASVQSGTSTTTTDRYGAFSFKNINISRNNGYVKVSMAGYFLGARTFIATANRTHNLRIRLIPKTNIGTFASATGGTVNLASGGKLVMPASAVTDASGNPYAGTVNVAMTWIDPTATNLPEIIPGDLRGITTSGEERGLETYGMLGVELTGPGNQPLKIAAGKTAELSFPIPASLSGTAPATIDLWHFDETAGRWKQEGTATRTGNMYMANVSHFSFWNCDAPFPLIELCMTIINASNNQPLNNVQVRIRRANNSYGSGWTDSAGNLCGRVPKNEPLTLQVMDQCHNVAYSQSIGPFSANTNLGNVMVTLPATSTLTITGTLTNCANVNVTNGAVIIYTGGTHNYVVPVSNGSFSHTLINCSVTLNFSIVGVDYTTLQQSGPFGGSGTSGSVNVGTLQACGTSSQEFAQFIIDGIPYNFASPPDLFMGGDSTGSFGIYTNKTDFHGYRMSGGTVSNTSFGLIFYNNLLPGTLPISQGFFRYGPTMQATQFLNPAPMVNITAFGPVLGFLEGNFNQLMNVSGTPKMVSCTFRIRRI